MTLSDKDRGDRSPAQVPADARDIFKAFRASGVESALAYTATERIRGLIEERALETARVLKKELTERIDSLAREVRTGFAAFEKRFEAIENRLDRIDTRLDGVEGRLGRVEVVVAKLQERLDSMDKRFDSMDKRFDSIDKRFDVIDKRFDVIDKRFESMVSLFRWGLAIVTLALIVIIPFFTMLFNQVMQQERVAVPSAGSLPIAVEDPVRADSSAGESATGIPDTAGDEGDVLVGEGGE